MRVSVGPSLLLVALAGCSSVAAGPSGSAAAPGAAPVDTLVRSIADVAPAVHWARSAAEHDALFLQIYRDAGERIQGLAQGLTRGRWAVILDADETVLDNSEYQKRIAEAGASYSSDTWNAWVREEAAGAKPGAAAFVDLVRGLGGRVAIVTNREESVCEPTRRNFAALHIRVDVVLCRRPGEEGKGDRFRAVQEGTTTAALPPLEVVAWVGDNIQDFPDMTQELRDAGERAYDRFGQTYFLLPNPMYGSWERNPVR